MTDQRRKAPGQRYHDCRGPGALLSSFLQVSPWIHYHGSYNVGDTSPQGDVSHRRSTIECKKDSLNGAPGGARETR